MHYDGDGDGNNVIKWDSQSSMARTVTGLLVLTLI